MAKQSVVDMLKKPISRPAEDKSQDKLEEMVSFKAREDIAAEVKKRMDLERQLELQQAAWNAVAENLTAKNKELDAIKAEVTKLKSDIATVTAEKQAIEQSHKSMQDNMDKLRMEYTTETQIRASAVSRSSDYENDLKRTKTELDGSNAAIVRLRSDLEKVTTELSKAKIMAGAKPPMPSVPEFDMQITARNSDGSIKSIAVIPKKVN